MKLIFAPEFKGNKLEVQIGELRFDFERSKEPFEIENPVIAQSLLRRGKFVEANAPTPAPSIQAQNQTAATEAKKK